ncbi:MAG: Bax inhibitor-1/YccA family protein [Phycisphaerales bacterium]
MSVLQSRNPAMRILEQDEGFGVERTRVMTIGGTVTATGILLSIVAVVGILSWQSVHSSMQAGNGLPGWAWPVFWVTMIAGFAVSLIIYKAPKSAPFVAPLHAVLEGAFVGLLTYLIPLQFIPADKVDGPMLAMQAAGATFAVAGAMLAGYASGILRVGSLVKKIIITAAIGLMLYTLALILLSFVGVSIWNGYADTGPIGIGFTVLCAGLASLFLLLDFQYIEEGVNHRAPKYMEWVGAWGLMITIVWLYIELLRLLAKLQSRD